MTLWALLIFLCPLHALSSTLCRPGEFHCTASGRCLKDVHRCDGFDDCGDNSDEDSCATCTNGAVHCSGRCVGASRKCDSQLDCSNGEDELNCTSCAPGSFLCDGSCWPEQHRCDGLSWCLDGTDERNCSVRRVRTVCNGISVSRCNGKRDCSVVPHDEFGCQTIRCASGEMACDGKCLKAFDICNGKPQCSDGRDELSCQVCKSGAFLCDGHRCVLQKHKCDGVPWCRDREDEMNCNKYNPIVCYSGSRCNALQDCVTWDDEIGCDECQYPAWPKPCHGKCILSSRICDGVEDCKGGEDEANCGRDTTTASTGTEYTDTTEYTTTEDDVTATVNSIPKVETPVVSSFEYYNVTVLAILMVFTLILVVDVFRRSSFVRNRLCKREYKMPNCANCDETDGGNPLPLGHLVLES